MSGQQPARKQVPIQLGGVWNQSESPARVGGNGMTDCRNLIYRRFGTWAKRPGTDQAYAASATGPMIGAAISGIRWYATQPANITQLVIAAQGALWTGGDPNTTSPAPLTLLQTFPDQVNAPVGFAPVYDPAANNGNGADILIISGFTGPYGFATGNFVIAGTPVKNQVITLTIGGVAVPSYTTLASDNVTSIGAALVAAINNSSLVTPGSPKLGQATLTTSGTGTSTTATVNIGALLSGTGGNSITLAVSVTGPAGCTVTASGGTLTGGGASTSAPLKYDGSTVSGLSYQIQGPWSKCVSWHDHVWFWGDEFAPDTLFASDIDQPENFTFMQEFGGYDIGKGDGDPGIRAVVPIGNILYVFKTRSIYAITGYDFQSGDYQFSVEPAVKGIGTPSQQCVAVLRNAVVFWSGTAFMRLAVGAFEPEHIGAPIVLTEGRLAAGVEESVTAVAGSFMVSTSLNNTYDPPAGTTDTEMLSDCAFFACGIGTDVPSTTLVYDDGASQSLGEYAWSKWTGFSVDAWIPFGAGAPSSGGVVAEPPQLFWVPPLAGGPPVVFQIGSNPTADSGSGIPFTAQTGWVTFDTPCLTKELHTLYLETECVPNANINLQINASAFANNGGFKPEYAAVNGTFPTTPGTPGIEQYQILQLDVNPAFRANAFMFVFTENTSVASFELASLTADYVEEAFQT